MQSIVRTKVESIQGLERELNEANYALETGVGLRRGKNNSATGASPVADNDRPFQSKHGSDILDLEQKVFECPRPL